MSVHTVIPSRPSQRSWRSGLTTVPALAGIGYSLAWLVGLSVSSASTDVRSTGAEIIAADAGHGSAVAAQFVLTEGIASLALAVVAVALGLAGIRAGVSALGRAVAGTGLVAATIAVVQCVLGMILAASAVPQGHAATAEALNNTINRLDGAKMFVLAAMAVAVTALSRKTRLLPRWLRIVGIALAFAITVSGLGYALLNGALAYAAWLSLPLLLVFVTGAGLALGRQRSA